MASQTIDKAKNGEGRTQRQNTESGKLRAPNVGALYGKKLRDVVAGDFTFRVILVRPEKKGDDRTMILDRAVSALEWTEESSVMSGSVTLHRPDPDEPAALPIEEHHLIRLMVRWGGDWYDLWEMEIDGAPEPTGSTGEVLVSLTDPLARLRRNERDWEFKKTKHRPDGWSPEQIVREVAKKEGVQLGAIAKGRARIKKLKLTGSGLEVIMRAYAREKKKTGRKFVVRFRNGKLEIVPIERHKVLYEVKGMLIDYSLETGQPKKKRPVTVIEAKGRIGKKKVEDKVFRREVLKRLGLCVEEKSYGKVDSKQDLIEQAMRDLADEIRVKRTATLQIPGIPFMERGDTVHWITEEPGWSGPGKGTKDRGYGYVTGLTHTVNPGDYQATVTISQADPYLADARARAKEDREEKKGQRDKNRKKGE